MLEIQHRTEICCLYDIVSKMKLNDVSLGHNDFFSMFTILIEIMKYFTFLANKMQ